MSHRQSPTEEWTLDWDGGAVTIQSLGGMLAPLTFKFPDGRTLSPLHVAPWGAAEDAALPGVLRRLRGEWPCLPYGASKPPAGLPVGWGHHAAPDHWDHGYTANQHWRWMEQDPTSLTVGIEYPENSDIERLERTVRVTPGSAAIAVELTIYPRRACEMPFALHPTFAVPQSGVVLKSAHAKRVETYPVQTEPQVSRLAVNASGTSLGAMPSSDGGMLSFTELPLPFATEELMQMVGCAGPFTVHYVKEGIDVNLAWDTSILPDALVWISNGGRAHYPWSGRHFALGIEPMSGFFDLGRVVTPTAEHSLHAERGLLLDPLNPTVIRYQLDAVLC